jgi:hypothetical protein
MPSFDMDMLVALSDKEPRNEDQLYSYINGLVGYHIPRVAVCPGHIAPFDMVADVFFGRSPRALVLAARGTGKTLTTSILNLLRSKFKRNSGTGHYAAVEAQGEWGYGYLRNMLEKAYFAKDLKAKPSKILAEWKNGSWVRTGTGRTTTGVTAYHPNRLVIDEVDLWDPEMYENAQYMLSGTKHTPESIVMSTAYTSYGLITTLLQQAKQRNSEVYRYCLWEAIERCPECRGKKHCPLHTWINPRTGKEEELCQGKALRSDGFIPYDAVIDEFYRTDAESFYVQKLLAAPARRSLIYPNFDPVIHSGKPPKETEEAPIGIGVDWGFDHPLVFTVFAQLGNGHYWGLEEIGERFVTPAAELEIAHSLNKKYRRLRGFNRAGKAIWDYPTFYCGKDQPKSIAAFAEAGFIVAPNEPRLREEGHKLVRRLIDPNKGPLLHLDPHAMSVTIQQLGSIHRDDKGREVQKVNDFADSARHVLATSQVYGGIGGGGGFVR